MRFFEGCGIVGIEWWVREGRIEEYVRKLIDVSKRFPTYVAIHPSVVVTKIGGIRRRLAIAPGTAVLCDREALEEFGSFVELEEQVWIEAYLLVPYTRREPCGFLRELGIEVGEWGHELVCLGEDPVENLVNVVEGGIAVPTRYDRVVEDVVNVALRYNPYFFILKSCSVKIPRARFGVLSIELPPKLRVFFEPLIAVGSETVCGTLGRALYTHAHPLDDESRKLFQLLMLVALLQPPSSPRASLYLSKLRS